MQNLRAVKTIRNEFDKHMKTCPQVLMKEICSTWILQIVHYEWVLQTRNNATLLFLKLFLKLDVLTDHCHGQNINILWYHIFLESKDFSEISCVFLINHNSSNLFVWWDEKSSHMYINVVSKKKQISSAKMLNVLKQYTA